MKSIVPNFSLFRSVTAALFVALLSGTAMGQNDLILQGIIDFSVPSGGSDGKAIHLVATNDIADLSIYGIGVANNGGGTDGQEYTFPSMAVAAGDDIFVARSLDAMASYFLTDCFASFEHTLDATEKFDTSTVDHDVPTLFPIINNFMLRTNPENLFLILFYGIKGLSNSLFLLTFHCLRKISQNFYKMFLDFPRDKLLERIQNRAQKMIKMGAITEVKNFMKLKVPKSKTPNKAIGIKEIIEYLDGKIEKESVIEKISIKTRQYAKRQTTWRRGNMKDWNKVNPNTLNKFLKKF